MSDASMPGLEANAPGIARRTLMGGGAAATLAAAALALSSRRAAAQSVNDPAILNFALNLEYLEAEFYLRAVNGYGLSAADRGSSPGTVTGGSQVQFADTATQQYAAEIAQDELDHVRFLRAALGSPGGG